jgi:hypothetical protein
VGEGVEVRLKGGKMAGSELVLTLDLGRGGGGGDKVRGSACCG